MRIHLLLVFALSGMVGAAAGTAEANAPDVSPSLPAQTVPHTPPQPAEIAVLEDSFAAAAGMPDARSAPLPAAREGDETSSDTPMQPAPLVVYYRYSLQEHDTLDSVSARFGIHPWYILWNNSEVAWDAQPLPPGGIVTIPSANGMLHRVRSGDTIGEVAARYEARAADIVAFPANAADTSVLREDSLILVPGGRPGAQASELFAPRGRESLLQQRSGGTPASQFVWPAMGAITSYFGPGHPLGIDIGAFSAPVRASAAGQVVFAGGDPCCSYGYNVVIRHAAGFETRYAHLATFAVTAGQWVEQGQLLGTSGNTGYSSGAHLHFELIKNGVIQNPMDYLP